MFYRKICLIYHLLIFLLFIFQDYSAKEWVEKGASKEKIIIGVPTYGRSFTLKNTSLTDIGAPAVDGGKAGNYTGEPGVLAFFEVRLSFMHFLKFLTHST